MSIHHQHHVHIPYEEKLLVGAVAGFLGTLVVFPLDTLKTRSQAGKSVGPDRQTVFQIFRSISTEFGFRGFYKGLHINLIGAIPEKALKLSVNEALREMFMDRHSDGVVTVTESAIAGCIAGFAQVIATNPMELIKLNLQLNTKRPINERIAVIPFIKEHGIRGLYRGTCSTLLRDATFTALIFPVYEYFKLEFARRKLFESSWSTLFMSGFISGGMSAWVVTPFDVIKTRLQEKGGAERYHNWMGCLKKTYHEEGARSFFNGALIRFGVIGLLYAVALLAFEKQKQFIIEREEKKVVL